ncbi:MAG: MFS transporter [Actinobacteria bacterium]|nr:MFS transporter [Actinomycetota bacterium]
MPEPTRGESAPTRSIGRVLLSRAYGPMFVGNLVSNSGTWFQNIAQVLLVYRLTGSTFLVGVVNFAQFAPILVLATTAGRTADRVDRRRLLIWMQACAAVISGLLALLTQLDAIPTALVITFAFATGVTTAFTTPTLQAFLPSLVPRAELHSVVALTSVTYNLARALGPVLGVVVVARYGIAWAFLVNSLSFLALVAALLVVRERDTSATTDTDAGPPVVVGLRFIAGNVFLFLPIAVVALVSLAADPVNTLTPGFSTEILGRPDTYAGFLVGAFGVGAVAAAFIVTRWHPSPRVLAVTLTTQAAGMFGFALSSTEWVSLGALVVSGFGFLASVTAATSLLHLVIDDAYRGRVMAYWSLSFHGVRPIGSLIDGALAAAAGLRVAGTALAVPALLGAGAALVVARRSRAPADTAPADTVPPA